MATNLIPIAFKALTGDGWFLFVTRFARLFAYGSLSVILVFYLVGLGLTEAESGLVLTLTLAGDVGGLACADNPSGPDWAPAHVDRGGHSYGRRRRGICIHTKSIF
jgi:hypothetical protein